MRQWTTHPTCPVAARPARRSAVATSLLVTILPLMMNCDADPNGRGAAGSEPDASVSEFRHHGWTWGRALSRDAGPAPLPAPDGKAPTVAPDASSPVPVPDGKAPAVVPDASSVASGGCFGAGLKFSPPSMTNPLVINGVNPNDLFFPRSGDPHQDHSSEGVYGDFFPSNLDVVIYLPTNVVLSHAVVVRGGRHVRIVGREWKVASSNDATNAIIIDAPSESAFIEGAHIDMNATAGDAIALRNRVFAGSGPYDTYVQNVRAENNSWWDGAPDHPDLIQDQGDGVPLGHVYVENFTGSTADQGIFLPGQSPTAGFYFNR